VVRAIELRGPDRIPISHGLLPGAIDNHGEKLRDVFRRYPGDFSGQTGEYRGTENNRHYQRGEEIDEWGCTWVNLGLGTEGQVRNNPLADWSALKDYRAPDPYAGEWPQRKERRDPDHYVSIGGGGGRLFERMHFLRGYDRLLIDIAEGRPEVETLRDLVLDHTLKRLPRQLESHECDGVGYMDDWGTQERLMIRPEVWRRLFKPAYKQIADLVHGAGKHFHFHTDGYTMEVIDDFIDIGVDVLNPQFSCMPLEKLADKCRGRVCIRSDIDRQYVLPFGTPDEVREYVRRVCELFASPQGGLIGHGEVGPDVRPENAEAMLRAFLDFSPRGAER
jgi:hypothetical protein